MKKKITVSQLFMLMVLVPYGTASLFFLVPKAKQDEWIAILIYSLAGILLQIIYVTLYYKYPEDTLVTYLPKIYGKFIGNFISILYIIHFTYIAARVFRDYLELISAFALPQTSMWIFGLLFITTIIYAIHNGVENLFSLGQLFFFILIAVKLTSTFLLAFTVDIVGFHELEPILSDGIFSLLKKSWSLTAFPYGESMVFTMIYPLVIENSKIKKAAILSTVVEAILLATNSILFILTLGVNFAPLTNFPLLETYRLIQIGDFLSRFDILFILIFLVNGFFKVSVFLYAAVLGTSQILHLKNTKSLSLPTGIIVFIASLSMAKNYPEHINIGLGFVIKYLHVPLFIIIPVLTLMFYYIKNFIKQAQKTNY